ncbi:MAG: amidohydrolase family protein [Thermoplasmata archaeon]|nr:amidohydrolase family protein [Thermoplasmata archaeon]
MSVRRGIGALGGASVAAVSYDRVVTGRAWVGGRLIPVEVGIDDDGRIGRVGRSVRSSGTRLDLGDAVLLPSATDLHAHFRDPGGPDPAESFATGTEGAALGGIGTVVDMPNTQPAVTDRERWLSKAALARRRIAIDVVLYGQADSGPGIRSLAPVAGGLKLYLSPTTDAVETVSEADLPQLLSASAASGLPLSVHAEWPDAFVTPQEPPDSSEAWNRTRPPESETEAVRRLLGAPLDLRLHIAHATLASTVDAVARAHLSCEATPHHLLLGARPHDDAFRKTNPPLRREADRAALWDKFTAGAIPILASDHAPHHREEKSRPFPLAPSGVPGVETMLPLFLELVRDGRVTLPVLMAAAMDRPARWLGLPTGRLIPGHRANFLAVDFRRRGTVEARRLRSPAGWSPFEGWRAIFPTWHFRDGSPIVRNGEFVGGPVGRIVRPEYARGRSAAVG